MLGSGGFLSLEDMACHKIRTRSTPNSTHFRSHFGANHFGETPQDNHSSVIEPGTCTMSCPLPITMRTGVIMEGGYLPHPWGVCSSMVTEVEGLTFFTIKKQDRGFASMLGLDLTQRAPWKDNTMIPHLVQLRNEAVDWFMQDAHLDDADPLADRTSGRRVVLKQPRRILMENVPRIVQINIRQVGKAPRHSMQVLSAAKRSDALAFEFTKENMEWLLIAVHEEVPGVCRPSKTMRGAVSDAAPNVFMRQVANRMVLYCRYRDADMRERTASRTVPAVSESLLNAVAIDVAQDLQRLFVARNRTKPVREQSDLDAAEGVSTMDVVAEGNKNAESE